MEAPGARDWETPYGLGDTVEALETPYGLGDTVEALPRRGPPSYLFWPANCEDDFGCSHVATLVSLLTVSS